MRAAWCFQHHVHAHAIRSNNCFHPTDEIRSYPVTRLMEFPVEPYPIFSSIDLINYSLIEFTEYFRTSWHPVHWSGSRTTRTEMIPWIPCLIIYLISHSGLDVASINLIINNQNRYTGIFWSFILDLQAILIAETHRTLFFTEAWTC